MNKLSTVPVVQLDNFPESLKALPRWCAWKKAERNGKPTKVPCDLLGENLSIHETDRLVSYAEVEAAYTEGSIDGIGLTLGDGLCGIDLDDCFDDEGNLKPYAVDILEMADSYAERSPSGKGLKIIVGATLPESCNRTRPRSQDFKLEIYQRKRFFTLTGDVVNGFCEVGERSRELLEIYEKYIGTEPEAEQTAELPRVDNDAFKAAVQGCLRNPPRKQENDGSSRLLIWIGRCRGQGLTEDQTIPAIKVAENLVREQLGENSRWLVRTDERGIRRRYGQSEVELNSEREVDWSAWSDQDFRNTPAQESVVEVKPFATPYFEFVEQHSEQPEVILEDLLERGDVANVVAPTKIGKTYLIDDLVIGATSGGGWMGHDFTRPCKVAVIDAELKGCHVWSRLEQIRDARNLPSAILYNLSARSLRNDPADLNQLLKELLTQPRGTYDIIILDTLSRVLPGDTNENDNIHITQVYNKLRDAAEAHGCIFIVIHHTSKGDQSRKQISDVGAGAGAQSRVVDCHLVIRRHKVKGQFVMEADVRAFPPFGPIVIRRKFPLWEIVPDADPTLATSNDATFTDFIEWCPPGEYEKEVLLEEIRVGLGVTLKAAKEFIQIAVDSGLIVKLPREGARGKHKWRKLPTAKQQTAEYADELQEIEWPATVSAIRAACGKPRTDRELIPLLEKAGWIAKEGSKYVLLDPEDSDEVDTVSEK